jgi:hypothetical protein
MSICPNASFYEPNRVTPPSDVLNRLILTYPYIGNIILSSRLQKHYKHNKVYRRPIYVPTHQRIIRNDIDI